MRAVVINYTYKIGNLIIKLLATLVTLWIVFALSFQVYMTYLQFSGKKETTAEIVRWLTIKLDGGWSDHPSSIWYQEPKKIDIISVTNKVAVGSLAGNRNLEFGIKNILEESLQDKEYELDKNASLKLAVEIIYLDVLKTQSSFSVLHNNKESVVIRLRGLLYRDGKLEKKIMVEESADEISMSAVLIDEGGKFNQQNLSSALKKASNSLITKLL
jgi:hypothetical protein